MIQDEDDFFESDFNFEENGEERTEELNAYRTIPVFKKAMEIFHISRAIIDTIKEKDDLFETKNFILTNAALISSKIAAAEVGELYHIKMECAYQIKMAAKELLLNVRLCEIDNLTDKRYLELLKTQIDEFRIHFKEWTQSFDRAHDIDDGWKIGTE